ncbi:MAG: hypothetical protein ACJA1L_003451 [Paracoccaceae bacterium]|jgi:hypothetical protein
MARGRLIIVGGPGLAIRAADACLRVLLAINLIALTFDFNALRLWLRGDRGDRGAAGRAAGRAGGRRRQSRRDRPGPTNRATEGRPYRASSIWLNARNARNAADAIDGRQPHRICRSATWSSISSA